MPKSFGCATITHLNIKHVLWRAIATRVVLYSQPCLKLEYFPNNSIFNWLQLDLNPEPLGSYTNAQLYGQTDQSGDDNEVISNVGGNNSTDDLSVPDDEMETEDINDNFKNAFYFATSINLHTFLAEQVASILLMS